MALIHQQIGVIVALIILVIAIFLFGVPLTARLRNILGGKRHDPSSSPRTVVSSHHSPFQRGSSSNMFPRRQDSQETLLDENIGDDKLDGILSLLFQTSGSGLLFHPLTAISLDPFLVVPPSLNDSLLVKQGLVEETTLPQPTHSAYDIQVCFRSSTRTDVARTCGLVTGITASGWAEQQCMQFVVADEFGRRY